MSPTLPPRADPHSQSNPGEIRLRHIALDLRVTFERRTLEGFAELFLERVEPDARRLSLDTRSLTIHRVEAAGPSGRFEATAFVLDPESEMLGSRLSIEIPPASDRVRIHYATGPAASALQWLDPGQTAARRLPFLFTQSQAIHARSWIPLQDTPAVRQTYSATIRVPPGLTGLMSAARVPSGPAPTDFRFQMPEPVPSYLIALAVGDLEFAPLGPRCGVWAEPPVLRAAAAEFADTGTMMEAAESLFGPYRWGRYDLLVLPPSFPYGGMENPRLTFATPTLLAGDRSLVSVIAHELAHSWSGNLVTNAEWADFWLNEGFTTYCERRIAERVFGTDWAEMEWALGFQTLEQLVHRLPPADQALRPSLEGRDPDHALTEVAYEKGALLLRTLESHAGRGRFDRFLRGWFDRHAFQSVRSDDFISETAEALLSQDAPGATVDLGAWVHGPGIPEGAALPRALAFERIDAERGEWLIGRRGTAQLPAERWSTQEWLRFLRGLPPDLPAPRRRELDREFGVGGSGNSEIAFQWLLLALQSGEAAEVGRRLEEFLVTIGRRKYVKPLYEELVKTPEGHKRALGIYQKARGGYHPITVETVDRIVAWEDPRR